MRQWRLHAAVAACACAGIASAQESMYTNAATMPSPGTLVLREQVHFFRYGTNYATGAERTDVYEAATGVQYGLVRDWSLMVDVPVQVKEEVFEASEDEWSSGIEEVDATLKWRFFKDDSGGINTFRVALLGGVRVATGDDYDFSSVSVNPGVGGVATLVRGRHGFNQELLYRFNTGGDAADNLGGEGPSDALYYNTSYVFRVYPERFSSETVGAWYLTLELNGLYETNGDNEIRWSPGLMYEGRTWGLEFMGQFPLLEDVHHRPELDFAVGAGLRFFF